jgi:hypothetical protein
VKCDLCGRDGLSEKELAIHLKVFHKDGQKSSKGSCPECGASLIHQEGCLMCSCGYSKC